MGTVTVIKDVTITDADGTEFDFSPYQSGLVIPLAGWTAANIGLQVTTGGSTFYKLVDVDGTYSDDVNLSGVAANQAQPIPYKWFGAGRCRLHSHDGSGNDADQASPRTVRLILKKYKDGD